MSIVHVSIAWGLLVGSLGTVFLAAIRLCELFGLLNDDPIGFQSESTILLWLLVLGVGATLLALIAIRIFLVIWFTYLRLLPLGQAANAERALVSFMTVWQLEPTYTRMRERLYQRDR